MKLKYIIGDLVKVWIDLEIKYQVAEVAGCNPYIPEYILTNWFIEDTIGVISVAEDRIMPIPLTPEILEKNGWKRNGGQYSFTFKSYVGDKVEYTGFFIEMFKNVHNMLKHRYFQIFLENKNIYGCFYVHELQHFLFGLGINHEMEV